MENDAALAKLPKSRSIWLIIVASGLLCVVFYYFYGGYLTMTMVLTAFLVLFYYAQDVLLYHPDLPANSRIYVPIPTLHKLPHETVSIRTPDKCSLHAFWIRQRDEISKSVPTFVYFHGNAGNMGHRLPNAWGIYNRLNCNILMVEYRGYGLSNGAPSERGLFTDAKSSIDYLYTRHDLDHTRIVIFGRSLGGAVTIELATDPVYSQKIMCAIVENTFTSIPDMAIKLVHPLVRFVPLILYKNKFHSISKISKCSIPVLFISGLADNLVPPNMMRKLYNECRSENKLILLHLEGAHNDTWLVKGYYDGIREFLNKCQSVNIVPHDKPPEKTNNWHQIQNV